MNETTTQPLYDTTIRWEEWQMQMSVGGETYPFVEDENANITGLGHQNPAEFAAAINRFDAECTGEPYPEDLQWTGDNIAWQWAVSGLDERLHPVAEGTPGALAITTLWGAR